MKLATRLQWVISGISLFLFSTVFVIVAVRLNAYSKAESEDYISKNLDIYANDLMLELEKPSGFLAAFNALFPDGFPNAREPLNAVTRFTNHLPNQVGFYCTTEDGQYYDGTGWIPPLDYNPRMRPWFIAAKENIHATPFTDIYVDAQRGIPMTTISRALLNTKGKFYGVIAVDYTIDQIRNFVKKLNESSNDIIFLITNNGNFIAHKNYDETQTLETVEQGKYAGISHALLQGGKFVEAEMDGKKYILSSKVLGETKWVICYGQTKTKSNQFAKTVYAMLLSFFTILFFSLVIVIGFVVRKMLKPVNRTAKSLSEIAQGNADLSQRIETRAFGEVREIVDSFNLFSASLEKIVNEIKDSKSTLTTRAKICRIGFPATKNQSKKLRKISATL